MGIVRAGVILILFEAIIIISFAVTSPFVYAFFDSMDAADAGDATDEIGKYVPIYKFFYNAFFAGMGVAAAAWFILLVYKRDPQEYYIDPYRRNY